MKICKKHSIVYLALFIWYNFFFYWRELDCKFLQGYLKTSLNKLPKKKKYLSSSGKENSNMGVDIKCFFSKNKISTNKTLMKSVYESLFLEQVNI